MKPMVRVSVVAPIAFLLVALIAALTVDLAHAQSLRPLSQSLLKSITELDAAIDQAIKAAQNVRVEDLKLSAQDGKFLEDSRARTIKSGELVRKQVDTLRHRQALQDLFVLKSAADGFARQLESLGARVHRADQRQDRDTSAKAANWLVDIERSMDAVAVAALAFELEAIDLLAKADSVLLLRGSGL